MSGQYVTIKTTFFIQQSISWHFLFFLKSILFVRLAPFVSWFSRLWGSNYHPGVFMLLPSCLLPIGPDQSKVSWGSNLWPVALTGQMDYLRKRQQVEKLCRSTQNPMKSVWNTMKVEIKPQNLTKHNESEFGETIMGRTSCDCDRNQDVWRFALRNWAFGR